jgi:hypothetical protein
MPRARQLAAEGNCIRYPLSLIDIRNSNGLTVTYLITDLMGTSVKDKTVLVGALVLVVYSALDCGTPVGCTLQHEVQTAMKIWMVVTLVLKRLLQCVEWFVFIIRPTARRVPESET